MRARLDQITEQILGRWVAQWVIADDPRTPFVFGNESTTLQASAVPWVRLWVRSAGGRQETLGPPGARRWQRPGFVIADIRTPPGGGQGPGQALGEDVRDIFEGIRLGPYDLRFNETDVQDIGEIEDGRWWQTLASTRFEYEDIR